VNETEGKREKRYSGGSTMGNLRRREFNSISFNNLNRRFLILSLILREEEDNAMYLGVGDQGGRKD